MGRGPFLTTSCTMLIEWRDETGEKTEAKSWNPSNDILIILKFILKVIKSSEMFHVREKCQELICILDKACMYILNKK